MHSFKSLLCAHRDLRALFRFQRGVCQPMSDPETTFLCSMTRTAAMESFTLSISSGAFRCMQLYLVLHPSRSAFSFADAREVCLECQMNMRSKNCVAANPDRLRCIASRRHRDLQPTVRYAKPPVSPMRMKKVECRMQNECAFHASAFAQGLRQDRPSRLVGTAVAELYWSLAMRQ